jgi:hypothetical protein
MSRISGSSYASKLMGRVAETGDGSTLSLDFTTMGSTIDPRITFSRADATARATFINSSGFVETVATAQAPRFTFSETSIGTPRGLLLEAPATNYLCWSQSFATTSGGTSNWDPFSYTITATGATSPDGVNASQRWTLNAGAGFPGNQQNITITGTTCTFSVFWKNFDHTNLTSNSLRRVAIRNGTTATILLDVSIVNPATTPSVGYNTGSSGATLTAYPNGWYRLSLTQTTGITSGNVVNLYMGGLYGGVTDAALPACDWWGAQLENGTQPSSYIKTTTTSLTRAVDTAIIAAGSNFSSWYTGGTTGTFVTEWCRCSPTTTQRTVIATSDVSNQHLHQYIAATTSRLRLADKVPAFIETTNASVDNSINKGAFSYSGSVQSLCLNGGTVVPGTLTFTTAPTWLSIGGPSTNGTSITDTAVVLNNAIRKIKYFPTRLSDAQIQTLTT